MLWLYVVDNEVKVSNFCYYFRCRVIILGTYYSAKYNKYSEKMSSFRLNSLILWVVLVLEFVQDLDGLEIDLGTSSTSWTVKNTEFKVSKAPCLLQYTLQDINYSITYLATYTTQCLLTLRERWPTAFKTKVRLFSGSLGLS